MHPSRLLLLRLILISNLLLLVAHTSHSQYKNPDARQTQEEPKPERIASGTTYVGVASGINNYSGLTGIQIDTYISPSVVFFGAAGLGGWGAKIGAGLGYDIDGKPMGTMLSIGYSLAIGGYEVEFESASSVYNFLLRPAGTLNFAATYNWKISDWGKFGMKAGYALAISQEPWDVTTGNLPVDQEAAFFLNLLQPGGILLGLELMILL